MCNIYAKQGHEPFCSNQAQHYPLGLPDVSMEYREKIYGMKEAPTATVAHLGPQSSHHSANESGLGSPI